MPNIYIRFALHRDRAVIKYMREHISGLCIPGNILSYSPDPTIAAISYIQKPYFVDPMTYIYAAEDFKQYVVQEKDSENKKFRPAIKKMTNSYGLTELFEANNYSVLTPADLTDEIRTSFVENALKMQTSSINDKKESAFARYSDMLAELDEPELKKELERTHSPMFLVPPYFYFSSMEDAWAEVNLDLAKRMKDIAPDGVDVVPVLLTDASALNDGVLDSYKKLGFSRLIIWPNDLNEKSGQDGALQLSKLKSLVSFAKSAQTKDMTLTSLYGSYFSVMLSKFSVEGVCHGIFYGEYKNKKAVLGGGSPPSRYYVRAIHEFLPIPTAIALLSNDEGKDLLDTDAKECMALIEGKPANILRFDAEPKWAQIHFLHARQLEVAYVESHTTEEQCAQLQSMWTTKKTVIESIASAGCINHLDLWSKALS